MKRVLISGENSYIGTHLEKWLGEYNGKYKVDTIDVKGDSWRLIKFSLYDVVVHVAGVVHVKECKKNANLYYKVNRDLLYQIAQKAKTENVKHFIYLSSMSVYGVENGVIGIDTPLNPRNNYGKSKLQGEDLLLALRDEGFKVAIVRPPMVYGQNCKGNYIKLTKVVTKIPIFPDINNSRSMIYIENLCEFLRLLIDDCANGYFFPQNKEYVNTSEMAKMIAYEHGKRLLMIKFLNPTIKGLKIKLFLKIFGDLVYDKNISTYNKEYCVRDFRSSISRSEGNL